MTSILLPERLTGAVWGHLIGDAMGVPYEFRSPDQVGTARWGEIGTYGKPPGTWSDDGALMLALLDSLLEVGFDTQDQGRRALRWWREGAYTPDGDAFDIGTTTSAALRKIESGVEAEKAGPTGEQSQSNGSLMRILPLALWAFRPDRQRDADLGLLVEQAMWASRVTHGHPVCQVTCALYVLVASWMLGGAEPGEALERATSFMESRFRRSRSAANRASAAALRELVEWPATNRPEGRGGALNAFWSAWMALTESTSYRQTIERAIAFGHDTDTTAAIAGGLAGIRWGIEAIPPEWLAGMRGREVVEPLVDGLLKAHGWKTSTHDPIRVDWVDLATVPALADAPGRLGMTFLPGKQYVGWHGPAWRDVERDVARLRQVHGCDVFLLLVEDHELVLTRTTGLAAAFDRNRIELRRHRVVDMDIPNDQPAYRAMLADLTAAIRAGKSVVVACRGGLGRTGTAVACLLVDAGLDPDDAIALTRASRRNTIERGRQVALVRAWGIGMSQVAERRVG